jgi:hypothetical protein
MSDSRDQLLDEFARCFARAAVDAFLAAQNGTAPPSGIGEAASHHSKQSTHEQHTTARPETDPA